VNQCRGSRTHPTTANALWCVSSPVGSYCGDFLVCQDEVLSCAVAVGCGSSLWSRRFLCGNITYVAQSLRLCSLFRSSRRRRWNRVGFRSNFVRLCGLGDSSRYGVLVSTRRLHASSVAIENSIQYFVSCWSVLAHS